MPTGLPTDNRCAEWVTCELTNLMSVGEFVSGQGAVRWRCAGGYGVSLPSGFRGATSAGTDASAELPHVAHPADPPGHLHRTYRPKGLAVTALLAMQATATCLVLAVLTYLL